MTIRKVTVSRDDDVYECFPDVVRTRSGRLICVYRESDSHKARDFSHIVLRTSDNDGNTWSDKCAISKSSIRNGVLLKWNCPRIVQLKDSRVLVLCDQYPQPPGEETDLRHAVVNFWWSEDDGEKWSGPFRTPMRGIVPDKLIETNSGACLLATHFHSWRLGSWKAGPQVVYRSRDKGGTWERPVTILPGSTLQPCEGSTVQLPDGEMVCYMRENSGKGISALKSFSFDEGESWEGPYRTLMDACHRPVAGLLSSGRVLITYRHQPGGMRYWAKNLFAYIETIESAKERDRTKQHGIILPLDHDRSQNSDGGYSGWVQLPSEEIFVVNYIVDDARNAQIRGYYLCEKDF